MQNEKNNMSMKNCMAEYSYFVLISPILNSRLASSYFAILLCLFVAFEISASS